MSCKRIDADALREAGELVEDDAAEQPVIDVDPAPAKPEQFAAA